MKTPFRTLFHTCRQHKSSFILNIVGLSVAFTTFYILMAQVGFEWGFDRFHKDSERIYRVEIEHVGGSQSTTICYPVLSQLIRSSSHIVSGGIKMPTRNGYIAQPGDSTGNNSIPTEFCYVTKGYIDVFTFDMIEGTADSLRNPDYAIVPLSLAEKLYGEQKSYLNKEFGDNASWFLRIGGVYRDFPQNSMIQNIVYQVPDKGWEDHFLNEWSEYSHICYLKLDKNADPDHLLDKFKIDNKESDDYALTFHLRPLKDIYYCSLRSSDISVQGNRNITLLLFSIAALIVLISGINFMNFSMALVPFKMKGINLQLVLGASPLRLRINLVLEALFSAFLAFLLSLLTVHLISATSFTSFLSADMALAAQPGLLLFTGAVALLTGFLAGFYPAHYITSFPLARVVNGSFALSSKGRMLRNALIGVQFLISLTAVIVVLFMYLQNRYVKNESPGFDKEQIVYLHLNQNIRARQSDTFVNKLKQNPFIEEVAFIEQAIGEDDSFMGWGRSTSKGEEVQFDVLPVTADYLRVLGIRVTEGRDFRQEDENRPQGAFIFNQAAKKKFNLGLGETVGSEGEIIGFMPDIKFQSFRHAVGPMAFFVWGTENWGLRSYTATIRLKAGTNMYPAIRYIEATARELDPEFNNNARFYDSVLQNLYKTEQKQYTLVSVFSLLIVFISIVGVFGLVVFETQTRRKEVGILKVFGSSEFQVLCLFNRTYLSIVLLCSVVAVPLGYYITERWMENFVYHIPIYPWVGVVALIIVLAVVAATVTIQSWKASRENPVDTIGK